MQNDDRVRLIVMMVVLLGGLIFGGCQRQQAAPPPPVPEVSTVTIKPQQVVLTTELPGRISSFLVAEIRPQVNGIIQKRLFDEGFDVRIGEVLFQIDPATYQAAYDNTRAALARAEANLPSIRLRVERYKELVAVKAVSQQDYDDAAASLKQVEADIEYWKAAVVTAHINLGYTRITAPITGRIGKSNVTVGALVTAHQPTPLAVIQQLDPIYVDATQSSVNLLRLKQNIASGRIKGDGPNQTRVKLLLEDGTPYPLEGTLKFSDVTVDPSTGSFILRMIFPNPKHILLPGMYVRALVQEGIVDRAILVPQQAITRNPKGFPIAMVVNGSNKVEPRTLKIDRAIDDKWLVVSGLAHGDRVIVEGLQRARPGASVKVLPFDSGEKEAETHGEKPRSATKSN